MKHETKALQSGNPLEYKPIPQLLLAFSVPAIISCLINSIYNIVDQIFIGQGVGVPGKRSHDHRFPCHDHYTGFRNPHRCRKQR